MEEKWSFKGRSDSYSVHPPHCRIRKLKEYEKWLIIVTVVGILVLLGMSYIFLDVIYNI